MDFGEPGDLIVVFVRPRLARLGGDGAGASARSLDVLTLEVRFPDPAARGKRRCCVPRGAAGPHVERAFLVVSNAATDRVVDG